jgi:hypothetical protein
MPELISAGARKSLIIDVSDARPVAVLAKRAATAELQVSRLLPWSRCTTVGILRTPLGYGR